MRRNNRLPLFHHRRLLDDAQRQLQVSPRHDDLVIRRFDMATRQRNETPLGRANAIDALQNTEKNIPIYRKFHPTNPMLRG